MATGIRKRRPRCRSTIPGAFVLVLHSIACSSEEPPKPQKPPVAVVSAKAPEVTSKFMKRAMLALEKYLAPQALIYEIRISPGAFSLQFARDAKSQLTEDPSLATELAQVEYVESLPPGGGEPLGQVLAPVTVPIKGEGSLGSNLFTYQDVQLSRMARHFRVAKLAVDPDDGLIERLVVRRYLPFTEGIRGRIFVASPRMSGSIDVNEKGYPLKR